MAETKWGIVAGVVAGLIVGVALGRFLYVSSGVGGQVVLPVAGGAAVYYLYPSDCSSCGGQDMPSCVLCNGYFRSQAVLSAIGQDVGVSLPFFVSPAVKEPKVLVAGDGVVTLGDARSLSAITATLCRDARSQKACDRLASDSGKIRDCLSGKGVSADTVLLYSNPTCGPCVEAAKFVGELANLTSESGVPYRVRTFDAGVAVDTQVLDECLGSYLNKDVVPQLFCPADASSLVGGLSSLSVVRDFADKCASKAAGKK
ncbi:Uncharacterised protein [uncultured archaeon]|nr:Uncharacterised protein [uncultured archaeon]